jgi:hypothetical protein
MNQDSRDKPENDPVDVEAPQLGKASAQRALATCTDLTPLIPTNVGIQGKSCALFRPAASSLHQQQNCSWIPAFAGMSGAMPSPN